MKSLSLSGLLQPGPTLILFTPKNPLLQQTDYYDMVTKNRPITISLIPKILVT